LTFKGARSIIVPNLGITNKVEEGGGGTEKECPKGPEQGLRGK